MSTSSTTTNNTNPLLAPNGRTTSRGDGSFENLSQVNNTISFDVEFPSRGTSFQHNDADGVADVRTQIAAVPALAADGTFTVQRSPKNNDPPFYGADAVLKGSDASGQFNGEGSCRAEPRLEDFLMRRARKAGIDNLKDFMKWLDPVSREFFDAYPERLEHSEFKRKKKRTSLTGAAPGPSVKDKLKNALRKTAFLGTVTKRPSSRAGANSLTELMQKATDRNSSNTLFSKLERKATAASVSLRIDEEDKGFLCQQRISDAQQCAEFITENQQEQDETHFWWKFVGLIADSLMLIFVIYNMMAISWRIALGGESEAVRYYVHYVEAIFDVASWFLLGMKFFRPIDVDGLIVHDKSRIRRHYLKGEFALDFAASIPLQVILLPLVANGSVSQLGADCSRVNRFLFIFRFSPLWDTVSEQLLENRVHPTVMRLVKFICLIFMLGLMTAAPVYAVIRSDRAAAEDWGMIGTLTDSEVLNLEKTYLMTIMLLAGRSYPYPVTEAQTLVMLFMAMGGLCSSAIIIAGVASMVMSLVERSAKLSTKLDMVISTLTDMKQPGHYIDEVVQYYDYMFKVFKTFDYTDQATDELDDLPYELKMAIRDEINITTIKQIPLFATVADDAVFVKALATKLSMHLIMPGVRMTVEGEEGDEMFFLSKGHARVLIRAAGTEPVAQLKDGDFFGEQAVLYNCKRTATVVTETLCRVYTLEERHFEELAEIRPTALDQVLAVANERSVINQEARDKARRDKIARGASRIVNLVADNLMVPVIKMREKKAAEDEAKGLGGRMQAKLGNMVNDISGAFQDVGEKLVGVLSPGVQKNETSTSNNNSFATATDTPSKRNETSPSNKNALSVEKIIDVDDDVEMVRMTPKSEPVKISESREVEEEPKAE